MQELTSLLFANQCQKVSTNKVFLLFRREKEKKKKSFLQQDENRKNYLEYKCRRGRMKKDILKFHVDEEVSCKFTKFTKR